MKKIIETLLRHEPLKDQICNVAGENSLKVLRLLVQHDNDEKIAAKMNVKVSDVRAVLNKLNQVGIVRYDRTKDPETGWYYYNWRIDPYKMVQWYEENLNEKKKYYYSLVIDGEHYFCSKCGLENPYKFEVAMDYNFSCPIHQKPLDLVDEDVVDSYVSIEDASKIKEKVYSLLETKKSSAQRTPTKTKTTGKAKPSSKKAKGTKKQGAKAKKNPKKSKKGEPNKASKGAKKKTSKSKSSAKSTKSRKAAKPSKSKAKTKAKPTSAKLKKQKTAPKKVKRTNAKKPSKSKTAKTKSSRAKKKK